MNQVRDSSRGKCVWEMGGGEEVCPNATFRAAAPGCCSRRQNSWPRSRFFLDFSCSPQGGVCDNASKPGGLRPIFKSLRGIWCSRGLPLSVRHTPGQEGVGRALLQDSVSESVEKLRYWCFKEIVRLYTGNSRRPFRRLPPSHRIEEVSDLCGEREERLFSVEVLVLRTLIGSP